MKYKTIDRFFADRLQWSQKVNEHTYEYSSYYSMSGKRVMLSYLFQIEIRKTIRECFGILSTTSPTQSMSSTSTQVNLRDGL